MNARDINASEPMPLWPPTGGLPSCGDRNRLLVSTARRILADMEASAVITYLYEPGSRMLIAAVAAVTPLGMGSVERVPVDDYAYASAIAYKIGESATASSIQELGEHPELAVLAPFPFTVAATPLFSSTRRFGTLATYWPQMSRKLADHERKYLWDVAADTASELERLAFQGVSMEPPAVPLVVTAESSAGAGAIDLDTAIGDQPVTEASLSTPLIYHLHKLANALIGAERTEDAAKLAIARVMAGFAAQAMVISLVEGDRLRVVGAEGCTREFLRELDGRTLGQSSPETDAVTQKRQLIHIPPEREDLEQKTTQRGGNVWAVLPLLAGGHAVGSCSIGFHPDQTKATTQRAFLTALSTLLGQTFERTLLYEAQHTLAQKLQQALLPRMLPQHAGVLTSTRYVPTNTGIELGGDWYDLINLPGGGIGAVIGDVQGHNISAAVVMGQLRSAVRAYAAEGHDPITVLHRTNRLLVDLDTDLFATCCCVWFDPNTGAAEIATAGHHVPLIRSADGRYHAQDLDTGIPMGIDADASYRAVELTLPPGTLLVLYTDGLVGAGEQRSDTARDVLEAALADSGNELETLGDRLISNTVNRLARADDTALLLLRYEGAPAEPQLHIRSFGIHRRDLQGVRRARLFLREWLHSCQLTPVSAEAELLASEVVTNALVHGDSDVDINMRRYPEHIRVEVRDSDLHLALPVEPKLAEDEAEGGRGLVIVSAIASAWGNSPSGRGKTVWFELRTPAAGAEPDPPS
jgi:serine phosphatase RsbU (regulator of sigma subunit)/anti-sigma regulatory factor (Ser/Thr protein kinase)